jgi:type IX secretion system substrate protein
MKKLFLTIMILISILLSAKADEQDTLWFRWTGGIKDIDFTLDDEYVIVWTNAIEFWETKKGVMEFSIVTESTGDYNYNEEFLVFAQDSTPKLLDWQTREVIEGFEKEKENIGRIRTAKSKNEFMAQLINRELWGYHKDRNIIYFWDINNKSKIDSINPIEEFKIEDVSWRRRILDYDYLGNNDEFIYVKYDDNNNIVQTLPVSSRKSNYFYHIYNVETKELIDSIFIFQEKKDNYYWVDNLTILSDRSKIALNNKAGEINFYDLNTKLFYDKFIYANTKSSINEVDFENNEVIVAIADGTGFRIINRETNEMLQQYPFGVEFVKFSNKSNFFAITGSTAISIRNKRWIISNIIDDSRLSNFTVTPNPATHSILIDVETNKTENLKLSLIDLLGNQLNIIENGLVNTNNYQTQFNISHLPVGTYFIRLEIGSEIFTNKFIKE